MTPERWERVAALYHAARTRPASDRVSFLANACADDDALRQEVESLLNESVSEGGFLDQPALLAAAGMLSDVAPATPLNRSIGAYEVQALLGIGGMGEVYRARDPRLGRDVAIKMLPSTLASDADRLARFEREARMLAALNHPHICSIYGIEECDSIRFLILELVEGETLADRLVRAGASGLPAGEALTIARQITDALEAAHDKGIVHRDLKPANIKITPDGVVKVLDFGVAKAVASPALTTDGTNEGLIIGTAAYMSPEQARGQPVDKRTDIWSFGCVLYEMLTGRGAFADDTASDTIVRILEVDPDWSTLPQALQPRVLTLLRRCLHKDAKRRLRDIGDARIEIDEALTRPDADDIARLDAPRHGWRTLAAAAVGVTGLMALMVAFWARATDAGSWEHRLANARFTPVTSSQGSDIDAAISRDGKFIAFMSDRAGPFHAWLNQAGTGDFRDLTPGPIDYRNPGLNRSVGFSADSSEIWINGTGGERGYRLRRIPLVGGEPRVFLTDHAVNVAWSHDGTRLVYFTYDDGDPLFVADGTGGNATRITISEPGLHNHFPAWSLDDRWIYYGHGKQSIAEFDVWRIPAAGGTAERLTHHNNDVRYLTPVDARTVLYVSPDADRSGPWLWALDVERRVTRRLNLGLERYLSVAASGDGERLVATVGRSTASLWSVPILNRLAGEHEVKPYPMPSAARALSPRFAAASLFYLSSTGAGDGLWRLVDGKSVEVWKGADGAVVEPPAVSPGGDRIAIVLERRGKLNLTIVSADGADHRLLSDAIDVRGAAAWSPDGKWIVTGGTDSAGPALFMIPVDGSKPIRLVDRPAYDPVWSPDGSLIVYVGQQGARAPLLAVRPDRATVNFPAIQIPSGGAGRVRFLPGHREVIYMQGAAGAHDFWLLDLATNKSRRLTQLSNSASIETFDITPDGTQIVFDRVRENADVRLIDLPKR